MSEKYTERSMNLQKDNSRFRSRASLHEGCLCQHLRFEVAAKEVADELKRQGIGPDERVTLTIEPELFPGRRDSLKLVVAAGLTDARTATACCSPEPPILCSACNRLGRR
jgi:hypothetical protein